MVDYTDPLVLEQQVSLDTKEEKKPAEKEDTKLLVSLLMCSFIANTLYMNVASLLPAFVDDHYADTLNGFSVGCLMSIFPIGFLIAAPLLGANLEKFGRKNTVIAGVLMMTVATLIFGCASYFGDNVWAFYFVSMFARLV